MRIGVASSAGAHRQGYRAGRQGYGGDDAADIGLEQVRAHAGHVAHIVAHVVSNDSRVARVVLGNPRLHLSHQVRPNIGGLGEYASADSGEQGDGACAKAEAGDCADVLEHQVEYRYSQEADAHNRHAHNRAAGEGDAQSGVKTPLGGGGGPHVGAHGNVHANNAGETGADGAGDIGYGGGRHAEVVAEEGVVEDGQDNGYNNRKGQERHVLPAEKGVGSFLYRDSYCLDLGGPLVRREYPGGGGGGESQRQTAGD